MSRRSFIGLGVVVIGLTWPLGLLQAQQLVDEALQVFPSRTERLEYSNLRELRQMPNYETLRQRYAGPRLQELEKSLDKLGIEESDVDEMVLGWGAPSGDLYGMATGRFRSEDIAGRSAGEGWYIQTVDDELKVYCLSSEGERTCLALLDDTRGVFGSLEHVSSISAAILTGSSDSAEALSSRSSFAELVSETKADSPLWGVAEGSALVEWLRFSTPLATGTQIDWKELFSGVERLGYAITVDDEVHLKLTLDCGSASAASNLRGLFDSLRVLGQVAWQGKNPNVPNPFASLELKTSGSRVELKLDAPVTSM